MSMKNENGNAESSHRHQTSTDSSRNTPVPWDPQTGQERPNSRGSNHRRDSREPQSQRDRSREPDPRDVQRERIERYGSTSSRPPANRVETERRDEYAEQHPPRKHPYDVQSMETAISSPRTSMIKNPIPSPSVTVRSEYPTLTRSRQQQSLTCLVTIEVPEGKWRPDPEDLRGAPVLPPPQQEINTHSNAPSRSPAVPQQEDWQVESQETLEEVTDDLRTRVDNWHGLDFSRYEKAVSRGRLNR